LRIAAHWPTRLRLSPKVDDRNAEGRFGPAHGLRIRPFPGEEEGPQAAKVASAGKACLRVLLADRRRRREELKDALEKIGGEDIMIVVGGVIPPQDYDAVRDAGASASFPPGPVSTETASRLLDELNQKLGYGQKRPAT
jgi:hypothetical protein